MQMVTLYRKKNTKTYRRAAKMTLTDVILGIAFTAIAWFFGYKIFMYLVKFCSFMLNLIFGI